MSVLNNCPYNTMHFTIVPGERKNDLVICENGKFFRTNFVRSMSAYKWKCINKKCTAKIYIDEKLTVILKYDIDHKNHEIQSSKVLSAKLFSNQLKRKLGKHTAGTTSTIVNWEILNNYQIRKVITSYDVCNIKQCLHRERKKHILSLPKSRVEVIADPMKNLELNSVENDTCSHDGNMSSDNGQSVSAPRSSINGNVKPKIEHLDNGVQQKLRNNLDEMLLQQARPAGQDEYVRPSVIVWNPAAMRRQPTFAQSLQDAGAANRNNGTYFQPV